MGMRARNGHGDSELANRRGTGRSRWVFAHVRAGASSQCPCGPRRQGSAPRMSSTSSTMRRRNSAEQPLRAIPSSPGMMAAESSSLPPWSPRRPRASGFSGAAHHRKVGQTRSSGTFLASRSVASVPMADAPAAHSAPNRLGGAPGGRMQKDRIASARVAALVTFESSSRWAGRPLDAATAYARLERLRLVNTSPSPSSRAVVGSGVSR